MDISKSQKWLYSLGANIHADTDYAFRLSCENGHIKVAKWLYSLGADVHADNDYAFRYSCGMDISKSQNGYTP